VLRAGAGTARSAVSNPLRVLRAQAGCEKTCASALPHTGFAALQPGRKHLNPAASQKVPFAMAKTRGEKLGTGSEFEGILGGWHGCQGCCNLCCYCGHIRILFRYIAI
jgi:hypothetical protein